MALSDPFVVRYLEDENTGEEPDDEVYTALTPAIANKNVENVSSDEIFEYFSHGTAPCRLILASVSGLYMFLYINQRYSGLISVM